MICWPSLSVILDATRRAIRSVEPPAGNGTTSVTGRFGKLLCAVAGADIAAASIESAPRHIMARRVKAEHKGSMSPPVSFLMSYRVAYYLMANTTE
jgi:hypothetical protein